jgi:nucleoside-diphosphate-sugar epimerase/uncharacterized membrane protein
MERCRSVDLLRRDLREPAAAPGQTTGAANGGTVLVTGSSGFLGRALIARLSQRYDVVGLDFMLPDAPDPSAESIRIDLTSEPSVRAALARVRAGHGERIASVVHLAGYYDLSGEPNPLYEAVTVRGTERLLRALAGFQVEQFVFASTLLVHAPTQPGRPIDEDAPLQPKTPYPASKVATETVIAAQHGAIPTVILRLAGVYDEQCRAAFLAQQIANIYERQLISRLYPGDSESGQPYLHLDDLADAVELIIARRHALPRETTLLLGEPETVSYATLQREIGCLIHGEAWATQEIPPALAKAGQWLQEDVLDQAPFVQPWMIEQASDHYELDVARARDLLEWSPRHRLRAVLPAMIAALRADPPGWYAANKLNAATVAAADDTLARSAARAAPSPEHLAAADVALAAEHRRTQWAHLTNMALGLWLAASPFAIGLFDASAAGTPPAAGLVLAPPTLRNAWLAWSEIASGLAILGLSAVALARPGTHWSWATAAVGLWVLFAPLVFWTTSAAAYGNDTLVGMLAIALAVMVPPQPGIGRSASASPAEVPLGWSFSPSSYVQRVPIVGLAFIGLFVSRYLAAYQLGHIDSVWEPWFGPGPSSAANGTAAVITSDVSKAFPIADAGFGAIAYALDILTGAIGDRRRWRTMPWLVLIFGLLVVPLGLVSVWFIIIQPTIIGALCTLCLAQTAVTLILIPYSLDEVLATLQFLLRTRRAGGSLWRVLWRGGPAFGSGRIKGRDLDQPLPKVAREFLTGGVSYPWTLVVAVLLGAYLMATPLLGLGAAPLAHSHHVVGCLAIAVAVTALAELARAVRFGLIPLGLWTMAAPFLLESGGAGGTVSALATGLALVVLALPRGRLSGEHYGGWDRAIL